MENKIKKKLISILKELNLYEKIREYSKSEFYINNIDVYDVISLRLNEKLTYTEQNTILSYFDWRKIREELFNCRFVLPPTNDKDYNAISEFFDKNGILWASGDKFSEFNGWKNNKTTYFDVTNSYITFSSTKKYVGTKPKTIKQYIKDYNSIKEYINNNIDAFIIK